ncbi:DUF2254 domain-containing protein [Pseudonocardia humida]|uniref:DUF2254 domain-containing protein n=1 Tax=Pseudonocardia humida TaxID=2800819 RepID=A0ABT1ACU5_9PSEU|nr:DUF2254 domain-containing protein [Pseudonocardia humida]MCO1660894.1 DUF2254 domain-containing protein [Pseudonocardia humida]
MTAWARERFWLVPTVCAASAVALGLVLTELDVVLLRSADLPFLFGGGPEGARALLSAVITSMISFTALTFSITIVVLQLTSGQFSPRVLRTFLRDRFNQVTLGVFVATFSYAMTVLRSVRGTAAVSPFVPQIAVTTAFGFVLTSVLVFLGYLHHTAQAIRVATIIDSIGAETRAVLERRHPPQHDDTGAPVSRSDDDGRSVPATRPGVLQSVDDAALARLAGAAGGEVEVLRAVGEFVPAGAALLHVRDGGRADDDRLRAAVVLGKERSMDQDVGFGLRQLVDIAARALSPGVNDATTAVQVVDQLHDLLRRLATRPLPGRRTVAVDGRTVVTVPEPDFEQYLDLAVEEIQRWGADDPRIQKRLEGMVRDLVTVARPENTAVLARRLARWDEHVVLSGGIDLTPSDVGLRRPEHPSGGRPPGRADARPPAE